MNITRKERKEMDELSKSVFGVSTKWQKIWNNGVKELITRTKVETIPGKNGQPDTTKEVQEPVLTPNGVQQFRQKYYTLEEVKSKLLEMKANIEAFHAAQKKQREEQEAKQRQEELQKNVQEQLAGSAIG